MQWLGDSNVKSLNKIKEEDSTTTLRPSNESSPSQEQSMESLSGTMDNTREGEISECVLDTVAMNVAGGLKETDVLQTKGSLDTTNDALKNKSPQENLKYKSDLGDSTKEMEASLEDKCVTSRNDLNCEKSMNNSVNTSNDPLSSICNDDIILSSSKNPGLASDHLVLSGEIEQLSNTEPSLQMNSTPKLGPYQDVGGEQEIEMDKEGYREGISRDSGIHESKEDVEEVNGDHRWADHHDTGEYYIIEYCFSVFKYFLTCSNIFLTCSNIVFTCSNIVLTCSNILFRVYYYRPD